MRNKSRVNERMETERKKVTNEGEKKEVMGEEG